MKKLLLLYLCLLSVSISQSQIEIFNDGVLEYTTIDLVKNVSVKKYNNVCPTGAFIIPNTVMYNNYEYTITNIGEAAFRSCSNLTSVNIPSSVSSIGKDAFNDCSSLNSLNIPSSVASIGEAAFKSCSSLSSVNIPSGISIIEVDTFASCSDLTSINIPNTVTSIGERAFAFCNGLTSINIPDSVTSIDEAAFISCTDLTSVTVNWMTPLVINANVFALVSIETLSLTVPLGTKSAYQAALVWQDFGTILNTSDFINTKLQVYPNPVKNQIIIQLENTNALKKVNIYNTLGQLVKEGKTLIIDVRALNSGIYFLEIETSQGKLSKKIIKK